MKILPVNKQSKQNFYGLWNKKVNITGINEFHELQEIENYYYPFADESKESIEKAVAKKTFTKVYDSEEKITIKSSVKIMNKLKFFEEEFQKYKCFYGKKLPPNMKKIELELKKNFLDHYLNKGLLYKIKQLLHNISYILPKSLSARAGV